MTSAGGLPTISLFSGAAIGDKGLEASGFRFLLFNEVDEARAALVQTNFRGANVIVRDVNEVEKDICERTKQLLSGDALFSIVATPPCQGMSQNGLGKLLSNARKGLRPKFDPRNRLILPARMWLPYPPERVFRRPRMSCRAAGQREADFR